MEKAKETRQQDNDPPLMITTLIYNLPLAEDKNTMGDSMTDMHMTNMEQSIQDLHGNMDQMKNDLQNLKFFAIPAPLQHRLQMLIGPPNLRRFKRMPKINEDLWRVGCKSHWGPGWSPMPVGIMVLG